MYKYYPPSKMNEWCPIWDTPASFMPSDSYDGKYVSSPRAGGQYRIDRTAISCMSRLDDRAKARLTSWLVEQRDREGQDIPVVSTDTLKTEGEQRESLPIPIRADRLLQWIESEIENIGTILVFTSQEMNTTTAAAWSESINFQEVKFLLDHLCEQGWLERPQPSLTNNYLVTVEGYNRLAELKTMNDDSTSGDENDDSSIRVFGLK